MALQLQICEIEKVNSQETNSHPGESSRDSSQPHQQDSEWKQAGSKKTNQKGKNHNKENTETPSQTES